jgi:hypothetical protein
MTALRTSTVSELSTSMLMFFFARFTINSIVFDDAWGGGTTTLPEDLKR